MWLQQKCFQMDTCLKYCFDLWSCNLVKRTLRWSNWLNYLLFERPHIQIKCETFLKSVSTHKWIPSFSRLAECCLNQTRKDENLVSKLYSNPPWIHAKKVVQTDLTYSPIVLDNSIGKSKFYFKKSLLDYNFIISQNLCFSNPSDIPFKGD